MCNLRQRNEEGDPPRRTERTNGRVLVGEEPTCTTLRRKEARPNESRPRDEAAGEVAPSIRSGEPRSGEGGGVFWGGGREGEGEPRSHRATKERSVSSVKSRSKTARQGW